MARVNFSLEGRGQFIAIARVRWQLFANSLRKMRGRLELVSRILVGLGFGIFGLGGAIGLGSTAWVFVSQDKVEWIAMFLWVVLLFWQLFPLMAIAFTENFDSSDLLRFPLSYRSYFLVRLTYGSIDAGTAIGVLWLLGITVGIGVARPNLVIWAALVLLAFALLNVLLARMIFAWIERWLATRRTREVIGVVFFLLVLSVQLILPLLDHYGETGRPRVTRLIGHLLTGGRFLPPGLVAEAISHAGRGELAGSLAAFALLFLYGVVILWLLHLRLRSQYRGEYLSETTRRPASPGGRQRARLGWSVAGVSGRVAAIFEKELRYLLRSSPMLITLIMPVFVLVIFRLTPGKAGTDESFLAHASDLAFPIGTGYGLLALTNLVYNIFGADGGGIQFFFVSPVSFREIVFAKNLAQATVLGLETVLVWIAVCLLFRAPAIGLTLSTLSGLLFAASVNFAAGNLLSFYSPKKYDFGSLGRQRAANMTILASFGIQLVVFGLSWLTLLVARSYGKLWLAAIAFLALATTGFAGYTFVLNQVDRVAISHRENLIAELCRA
jgi:ABC-2 type transport system permease protein